LLGADECPLLELLREGLLLGRELSPPRLGALGALERGAGCELRLGPSYRPLDS
jgi:hypothetical protein